MPSADADDPGQELLLHGGRIYAAAHAAPAEALLVRGGRVAALGSEAEVRAAATPSARRFDLAGATVTPGLTDAHAHLTAWALKRSHVDLNAAGTLDEALALLARAAAHGHGWLRGYGWDANRWGAFPDRAVLDTTVPGRPVFLESHDLHSAWLNSAALERCGITRDTPDPAAGTIVRDAAGEPTGILLENAAWLALAKLPQPARAEISAALLEAQAELHRLGLTGVHSVEMDGLADFEALHADGALRLRVLQTVPLEGLDAAIERGLRSGAPPSAAQGIGDWLRVGGVKMFLDGALGSRTAWMRAPYTGEPENRGVQTLASDDFREHVRRAAAAGISSTVHAIGDAAVELALQVLGEVPPAALPHRIEHLQLCPPELWERVARSGIVASMQPVHLRNDIPAAERYWGHARSRGAYAFRPLLDAGALLAFGSDVPVETVDPREGLFAAVRRVGWSGAPENGWYPGHALTARQALAAYTEGPALAAGEAERRGRLDVGCDADLVAWDRDPLAIEPDELLEMRCVLTAVGGEVVHDALAGVVTEVGD
jgi:predicted amidohydrolase YtcJ